MARTKAGNLLQRNASITHNPYKKWLEIPLWQADSMAVISSHLPAMKTTKTDEACFTIARTRMVAEQLATPTRSISDQRVLQAMAAVPRHEFVPESQRHWAYDDGPLPIGHGQTISQPYIVAFMTEQLKPQPTHHVLEIGTGSGYQAAVLAQLVRTVYSIEIIEPLAARAVADLQRLGYANVFVRSGDGYQGWPEQAPFDSVIVTCAPEHIPQPLVHQLKDGGRMLIPVGPSQDQKLYVLEKQHGMVTQCAVLPVRFVPMTGLGQDR
jgi:protein-L-isoaspartate(D-aspartate) O-methyltransferase